MFEVDRMVALIRPTAKFLDWINQTNETEEEPLELADLQIDCTVLLIPIFEDTVMALQYIEGQHQEIFENELEAWVLDSDQWPEERNYKTFCEFLHIELHSVVYDLARLGEFVEEMEITTIQ